MSLDLAFPQHGGVLWHLLPCTTLFCRDPLHSFPDHLAFQPMDSQSDLRLLPVLFRRTTPPFSTSNHPSLNIYFIISCLLNIMYVLLECHIIHSLIILTIVRSLTAALKVSYVIYGLLRLSILEASGTWLISIQDDQ